MRTTLDLPADLHAALQRRARTQGQTMSRVAAELLRGSLVERPLDVRVHAGTGLPVVDLGRRYTTTDVAEVLDEP